MKHSFNRQYHINNFRNHCHFNRSQENPFSCFSNPCIFLWRNSYNGCRIDSIFPMGDGGDMKLRIIICKRIITGVITKRTF